MSAGAGAAASGGLGGWVSVTAGAAQGTSGCQASEYECWADAEEGLEYLGNTGTSAPSARTAAYTEADTTVPAARAEGAEVPVLPRYSSPSSASAQHSYSEAWADAEEGLEYLGNTGTSAPSARAAGTVVSASVYAAVRKGCADDFYGASLSGSDSTPYTCQGVAVASAQFLAARRS